LFFGGAAQREKIEMNSGRAAEKQKLVVCDESYKYATPNGAFR
jgi:hypothetical protein